MKFLAIVRYEILWNIRKKKFIGMFIVAFALATLTLAGGYITSAITGEPVDADPEFVISSNAGLGGLVFFLFAVVTTMNVISAEFESGTITPLLAKPLSRTTVFLGKLLAAFLTLLATYSFLIIYMAIGSFVAYGPQTNLHLIPLSLLGALFSTLIWISIVLLFGTLSKSSLMAALGPFGIWIGTTIIGQILQALSGQGWILNYIPGVGNFGYVDGSPLEGGFPVSTGTDSIGANLVNYILHPAWEVTYYKIDIEGPAQIPSWVPLSTEPLSNVILTSIAVAVVYFIVFFAVSWYVFKHAQVAE
ncbi:MAG: ABC transporter permease [Candidatus Bathyarchaeota archaeon]|nr:MAG: ABC transporter permease [Candidatus Bathyarchaeota archaeon]